MNKICTSLEQSKKLIELGIDVTTADMYYMNGTKHVLVIPNYETDFFNLQEDDVPAWSLSALLELIPPYLGELGDGIDFNFAKTINSKWYAAQYIQIDNSGLATFPKTVIGDTSVDAAFKMVVWLKENNKI